jgi:ribonuclease HII
VVACAFCFGLGFRKKLDIVRKLKDSKQLSEKKRKKIFGELMILASEKKIYF